MINKLKIINILFLYINIKLAYIYNLIFLFNNKINIE